MSTIVRPERPDSTPPIPRSPLPRKAPSTGRESDKSQAADKPVLRSAKARSRRRVAQIAIALVALLAIIGLVTKWSGSSTTTDGTLVYYTVRPIDLQISVTERGNLESQSNVEVLCEVDDVRDDGINGTPIVWIVENGASVKKGDLIVELDASPLQDRLDAQVLDREEARAGAIQARVAYENQITQNATNLAEAELAVNLAELALQQFEDEDGGTFQIDLQTIELDIREAEANQLIQKTNLEGVEQLYQLGYRSSGELAQARLAALKADSELANSVARKKELEDYTYRKTRLELEGARESARRARTQVERNNEASLMQAKAMMDAEEQSEKKEAERLQRYLDQLEKCKIYAPQDGMVAYSTGSSRYNREEIRAGAPVRLRQSILTIPNLQHMQVKTSIHESVLDQIQKGLKATVRVDAFPELQYTGTVQSVAVLPDQGGWLSSDTKVYQTVVTVDDEVEQLKPGMTAVVEIQVDNLLDVLAVPVQAILQKDDQTWCYVDKAGRIERRLVTLGATNDKFVEIRSGIQNGEVVVLNPSAVTSDAGGEADKRRKQDRSKTSTDPAEETSDEGTSAEESSEIAA